MKKILSLLLCTALLLSFAACSDKSSEEPTDPADSPSQLVDSAMAATPVMTIGEHSVMIPEYNFYYMTSYGQFMNTYGDYASMLGLDITKPFSEQQCGMMEDGSTWDEYFADQAQQQLVFTMAYNDKAKAENMVLDDENQKALDEHIDGIAPFAKENGITEEEYYTKCFGDGMTKDLYREVIERYYLAVQWQNAQSERIGATEYSDDEIEKYYQENESQFALMDYREFKFISKATNAEDETDEQRAAYLEEIKKDAKAMADKVKTEKDFIALALENAWESDKEKYKNDDTTLVKGAVNNGESDPLSAWLFDKSRKVNDVTVIPGDNIETVIMAVSAPYKNEEPAYVDIRHILIMTETEEGKNATDVQVAAARKKRRMFLTAGRQARQPRIRSPRLQTKNPKTRVQTKTAAFMKRLPPVRWWLNLTTGALTRQGNPATQAWSIPATARTLCTLLKQASRHGCLILKKRSAQTRLTTFLMK